MGEIVLLARKITRELTRVFELVAQSLLLKCQMSYPIYRGGLPSSRVLENSTNLPKILDIYMC